jgi:hypothetical protein
MAEIIDKCEGALETYDQIAEQELMFNKELAKFMAKNIDILPSTIKPRQLILNVLDNLVNNTLITPDDSGFGRCHSKSHASTGGGTGFGKSYSKRC